MLIYTGNGYQSPGAGSVPTSSGTETKQTNDSTIINNGVPKARPAVQYASLCLGALHYMFGHLEQARRSIDESMRVAQIYGRSVVVVVVVVVAVVAVVLEPEPEATSAVLHARRLHLAVAEDRLTRHARVQSRSSLKTQMGQRQTMRVWRMQRQKG